MEKLLCGCLYHILFSVGFNYIYKTSKYTYQTEK